MAALLAMPLVADGRGLDVWRAHAAPTCDRIGTLFIADGGMRFRSTGRHAHHGLRPGLPLGLGFVGSTVVWALAVQFQPMPSHTMAASREVKPGVGSEARRSAPKGVPSGDRE